MANPPIDPDSAPHDRTARHLLDRAAHSLEGSERLAIRVMRSRHGGHHLRNLNDIEDESLTPGERIADKVAQVIGSWTFIIIQTVILLGWIALNAIGWIRHWDPYPFILLNLVLSCLAAMQGAILLIAAKREDQVSSELAMHDYETNVEAEKIVKAIHELTKEIHTSVVKRNP